MTKRRIYLTLGLLSLAAFLALPFTAQGDVESPVSVALSVCGFTLFLSSWITAVYAWSERPHGVLHIVALIFLVPLGFLWGWAYLLAIAAVGGPSPPRSGV